MGKRTMRFGDYDTAAHGLWTLADWSFPEPALVEALVRVPGRAAGPLDLSAVLGEGEPEYGTRSLTVKLESSEGSREARAARISAMVNRLHGRRVNVVLPDHPRHYAVARLSVKMQYNDPAHAAVEVKGSCDPWLYAKGLTEARITATAEDFTLRLRNAGAMPVVPSLELTGEATLGFRGASITLSPGRYTWPELRLTPGDHEFTVRGTGEVILTYREGVLR